MIARREGLDALRGRLLHNLGVSLGETDEAEYARNCIEESLVIARK